VNAALPFDPRKTNLTFHPSSERGSRRILKNVSVSKRAIVMVAFANDVDAVNHTHAALPIVVVWIRAANGRVLRP
jgi:hypothetical protein